MTGVSQFTPEAAEFIRDAGVAGFIDPELFDGVYGTFHGQIEHLAGLLEAEGARRDVALERAEISLLVMMQEVRDTSANDSLREVQDWARSARLSTQSLLSKLYTPNEAGEPVIQETNRPLLAVVRALACITPGATPDSSLATVLFGQASEHAGEIYSSIAQLDNALGMVEAAHRSIGRPQKSIEDNALSALATYYKDATGKRPSKTISNAYRDDDERQVPGPFPQFVDAICKMVGMAPFSDTMFRKLFANLSRTKAEKSAKIT